MKVRDLKPADVTKQTKSEHTASFLILSDF